MKTTLKTAERKKMLKIAGFHESLGSGYGKKLLTKMGIKETAELDKHWIKEGNEIRVLHRKEPDAHPLMVSVNGVCHHIPTGLTEKIYVEVINSRRIT